MTAGALWSLEESAFSAYLAAMALLEILEVPDPRLRQKSTPLEAVTDETRQLIADRFETMYEAPGIGLAAVQVGVPVRLLVVDLQEPAEEGG
jgi:peptide deformylase